MQPQSAQDYKNLLTEVIKKQIVILGPDITLSKARNVKGLTVQDDGTVTDVVGSPQEVTQALIDQFVQLSGLIVKKTMEPLLLGTSVTAPPPPAQPTAVPQQPTPPQEAATPPALAPAQTAPQPIPGAGQMQQSPAPEGMQPPAQQPQPTEAPLQPAKNPLAA